jgi:tripeptide aminopeptidase
MSRLIEIFLEAASIEALSGKEKPVAGYIKNFLEGYNYSCKTDESFKFSQSDTGNLICRVGNGGDFIMLSHMDTARSTKQLKPVISGERITSSGDTVLGVDNRAGVAILLYVLEKAAKENIPLKDFTVAFTTCEETTLAGSKHLETDSEIKKAFIFDSSYRPGNFIYAACGSMGYTAVIKGKASHSGLAPEKGINSIAAAARIISNIQQGRLDEDTTSNIGKISGGSAVNVVPEETFIEGEVRSFNRQKVEDEIKSIHNLFITETKKVNAGLVFDAYWDFEPFTLSETDEAYTGIYAALKKCGLSPNPVKSLGGSDANSLNARGISAVNIGIGAQNPHSNDEFILLEDLHKGAEIALQLITK